MKLSSMLIVFFAALDAYGAPTTPDGALDTRDGGIPQGSANVIQRDPRGDIQLPRGFPLDDAEIEAGIQLEARQAKGKGKGKAGGKGKGGGKAKGKAAGGKGKGKAKRRDAPVEALNRPPAVNEARAPPTTDDALPPQRGASKRARDIEGDDEFHVAVVEARDPQNRPPPPPPASPSWTISRRAMLRSKLMLVPLRHVVRQTNNLSKVVPSQEVLELHGRLSKATLETRNLLRNKGANRVALELRDLPLSKAALVMATPQEPDLPKTELELLLPRTTALAMPEVPVNRTMEQPLLPRTTVLVMLEVLDPPTTEPRPPRLRATANRVRSPVSNPANPAMLNPGSPVRVNPVMVSLEPPRPVRTTVSPPRVKPASPAPRLLPTTDKPDVPEASPVRPLTVVLLLPLLLVAPVSLPTEMPVNDPLPTAPADRHNSARPGVPRSLAARRSSDLLVGDGDVEIGGVGHRPFCGRVGLILHPDWLVC
ncbi:hypothetical protein B0T16DRAFT_388362 [Cercophora newfieldiana]|uniref:Uncharacterized protein n=1 Tax=Cercophora newfieldiana TaxID=92897 RepID=A0AA39Y8K8_9PEZI|nr:hypothetical protein B0T16DRAFT_388362 [Cercophora newfieldiana]